MCMIVQKYIFTLIKISDGKTTIFFNTNNKKLFFIAILYLFFELRLQKSE